MFVFIDESGDSGTQFAHGSSQYFTCVAVLFSDSFNVDACDRAVDEVRRILKLPQGYEFHFSHCSDKVRRTFFRHIAFEEFCYYGFVLNKPNLFGRQFTNKHGFYDATVGFICENARPLLKDAKVVIDRCGDRYFKRKLEKTLKARMTQEDGTCLIKKVCMEASHTNNLLQLADMVCGAVARNYNSDRDSGGDYRKMLKQKEGRVQFWPK